MNNPTDNAQVEANIHDFIATNILFSDAGFPHPDDAPFLQERIIDSLGVVELVEFVQSSFGVIIEQAEATPEHFDSVTRLASYVRRKTSACPATA